MPDSEETAEVKENVHSLQQQVIDLQAQIKNYKTFVEAIHDGFGEVDINEKITYVNQKTADILECSQEQLIGRSLQELTEPKTYKTLKKQTDIRKTNQSSDYVISVQTAKGNTKMLKVTATPLFSFDGKFQGSFAVFQDISEFMTAEQELRKSEKRFRLMLENLPGGVFTHDMQGNILFVNSAACKNTGYTQAELIQMNVADIDPESETRDDRLHIWNKLKDGESKIIQTKHKRKDGSLYDTEIYLNAIVFENQPVILPIAFDISQRLQAEKDLRRSEFKFRSFVDYTYDWELWRDPERRLIHTTPSCQRVTGYTSAEFFQNADLIKAITHPEDRQLLEEHEQQSDADRKTHSLVFRLINKQGEVKFIEHVCHPIFGEKGDYLGRRVSNRDITLRKQAEEEIKSSRDRLKLLNKIIRHDLSNDLIVIRSAAKIYQNNADKEMLDEIKTRVNRSLKTIENYKGYEAFIESQHGLEEIAIAEVIEEVAKEYKQVELSLEGDGKAYADSTLSSVFKNLFSNAVVHGQATQIKIEIIPKGSNCFINFSDNGKGISAKYQKLIFQEGFYAGETGHTGIGLHIVCKTIERYGGSIKLLQPNGAGAKFEICLKRSL